MITGTSVHNQRIERLWVDLHRSVTLLFYRLFYFLEQHGLLDPLNEVHLFALHYVYMPRLNQALKTFQDGWNHHGIRTANVGEDYGISSDDPIASSEVVVTIPEERYTLSRANFDQLQATVNPLHESDNYGVDLYQSALQYLNSLQ